MAIDIPIGTFRRGRNTESCSDCDQGCPLAVRQDEGCKTDERPEQEVTIGTAFKLDKYQVTVGRMKKFVEAYDAWRTEGNPVAGAGAHPTNSGTGMLSGWASQSLSASAVGLVQSLGCPNGGTSTYLSDNDAYAVNCITWIHAFAFCIWDGGRLPTELEWEYAAAGGSENRLYPWGSQAPDATLAYFDATDALKPVGSYSAGAARWGHLDMAGLMWEWTYDAYYSYDSTTTDTDYIATSVSLNQSRVLRGGCWSNSIKSGALRVTRRLPIIGNLSPLKVSAAHGFRCARNP